MNQVRLIESPREALQGIRQLVPTDEKFLLLSAILRSGFDLVEVGSLASPKALPQMADSLELIQRIEPAGDLPDLMLLLLNKKGVELASPIGKISHWSYPFSVSPTFARLNLNATIDQTLETLDHILNHCEKWNKTPVIYFSMAFGNPYNDPWHPDIVAEWVEVMSRKGVRTLALSNVAMEIPPAVISGLFELLIPSFPHMDIGLHLHTGDGLWRDRLEAAFRQGVRRFDGVINGRGGCPMSGKGLLGNVSTQDLLLFLNEKEASTGIHTDSFREALEISKSLFKNYPE